MPGARIINRSRHLQLIPWLTYSALKSQVRAFSSVKLPRTGMLGLSVTKQGLPYSGGYSTCIFPLQVGRAGEFFHSGVICEGLSSLPLFFMPDEGLSGQRMPGIIFVPFMEMKCSELWDFPGVLHNISLTQVGDFSRSSSSEQKLQELVFISWWAYEMPLLSQRGTHSRLISHLPVLNED